MIKPFSDTTLMSFKKRELVEMIRHKEKANKGYKEINERQYRMLKSLCDNVQGVKEHLEKISYGE